MTGPVTISRTRMGSPFTISVYPGPRAAAEAEAAILTAYSELTRVEDLLTDFRSSPLNELNETSGIGPAPVPGELFDLIEFSVGISREAGGAFDVTFSAVGMLWREAFRTGIPPAPEAVAGALRLVDYKKVGLDRKRGTVHLPVKGMRIGLGSIGKGYGVDRAYLVLRDLGFDNFFVNGAGDVRFSSSPAAPRPWRAAIKNPFAADGRAAGLLEVRNGAVVTSGDYERYFIYRGKKYHHILDARSGMVRDDVASVTAVASTALLANAYTISAMALGRSEGAEFLRRRREAGGIMIASGGEVVNCNLKAGGLLCRK